MLLLSATAARGEGGHAGDLGGEERGGVISASAASRLEEATSAGAHTNKNSGAKIEVVRICFRGSIFPFSPFFLFFLTDNQMTRGVRDSIYLNFPFSFFFFSPELLRFVAGS